MYSSVRRPLSRLNIAFNDKIRGSVTSDLDPRQTFTVYVGVPDLYKETAYINGTNTRNIQMRMNGKGFHNIKEVST